MSAPPAPPLPSVTEPPVLLTSLASAALLDGRGDLELSRETRGAAIDWGGVYGQLVRLVGAWRLFLATGSEVTSLPECRVGAEVTPGGWTSRHHWGRFDVTQEVAAVASPPGAVRSLTVSVTEGPPAPLLVVSRFTPYLLPVLVEGIRPTSFRAETSATALTLRQRGFALALRSNVAPSHLFLNRASWLGGRYLGPIDEVASDHGLTVEPGRPVSISFLLSGGLERDTGLPSEADAVLANPRAAAAAIDAADRAWEAATPTLRFPNDPSLERAYGRARSALRRLYASPGENLTGLVAGYPWYSSIWCRDLAWMLPSLLWLGDFEWVARSLSSVFRFQSRAEIPMLGGEFGELPMQISPGPIFLFGTSDTTLYYPEIVDRYVGHSGDRSSVEGWAPALEGILRWGQARTDPTAGLLRNGGEAEEIAVSTERFSHVRYGIDALDTTIWDSTDRRDHAIDVQVLWRGALRAGARLLATGKDDPRARAWSEAAERLERTIREKYAWADEGYLYDSLREGRPVARLRPNALRAVPSGILDPTVSRAIVLRASRDDLTTAWGLRTLSSRDAGYDPQAYHDGEVWTIATAWAAEAALAAGEADLGVRYLRTIADRFEEEGGWANECYRGDRPEAYDSCFLLGFSIAPFLSILFERLWGLTAEAQVPRLEIRPTFPAGWTGASLERLRVGAGSVTLDWSPSRLRVEWSGPGALEVLTRTARGNVPPQGSLDLSGNAALP